MRQAVEVIEKAFLDKIEKYKKFYHIYEVEIKFRGPVVGIIPAEEQYLIPWLRARGVSEDIAPKIADRIKEFLPKIKPPAEEELMEEIGEEEVEVAFTTFQFDENGAFCEERHIKGLLKETLKCLGKIKRGARGFLTHAIRAKPDRIYFTNDKGEPMKVEDLRATIRFGHVMTRRGPRTMIKGLHYLWRPRLHFWILVTRQYGAPLGEEEIRDALEYGEEHGAFGDRTLGYGKYDLIKFKKVA